MTTGYIAIGGSDLDLLFAARTSAAAANTNFTSNGGVDLAQRFEPRGSTTPRANTGFLSGSTDLAQIFKDIALANVITVNNLSPIAFNTGSAGIAQYTLNSNGKIRMTTGTNTVGDVADWIAPLTNFGNYSVRATVVSGTFTSGAFGTYLNLASARTWTLSGGSGGVDAVMSIEIRKDSDGIVQDTATLTFHAERDV